MQLGKITLVPHRQGTEGWLDARLSCLCASEAPAMMGVSSNMTRDQLIAMKAVGAERTFSDYVQKKILDRGHAVEGPAREITEEEIGTSLSPVTYMREVDGLPLLASLDGIDMGEEDVMEHKLWNDELAATVARGEFPPDKVFQMEQQLLVSGAKRVHLVVSDGTREKRVVGVYTAQPGYAEKLVAGWKQLQKDVQSYVPPAAAPAPVVAKSIALLPAATATVVIVEGKLTVQHNLKALKPQYLAHINACNTKLETDQHFADADADAKYLREVADKLELGVEQLLGQMVDVNDVVAIMRELAAASDTKALQLEKAVKDQKDAIKGREVTRGKDAFKAHIESLNQQLGKPYMTTVEEKFAECVKNKRTVESLRNAVNTHLAELKIKANEIYAGINTNLTWLRENAKDYTFLFADTGALVLKTNADLVELANSRINNHKAEEARKQQERDAEAARQLAAQQATPAPTAAPTPAPTAAPTPAPASVATGGYYRAGPPAATNIVPITRGKPTLMLRVINERIAPLALTADGLEKLGFAPADKAGAAKLYHEADYPLMVDAAIAKLQASKAQLLQAA